MSTVALVCCRIWIGLLGATEYLASVGHVGPPVVLQLTQPDGGHAEALAYHPRGAILATPVALWDIAKKRVIARLAEGGAIGGRVCYAPDGTKLFRSLDDVLDAFHGTCGKKLKGLTRRFPARIVAIAASSNRLFVATSGNCIDIIDSSTFKRLGRIRVPLPNTETYIQSIALSGNGKILVAGASTGCAEGAIIGWNARTGTVAWKLLNIRHWNVRNPCDPVQIVRVNHDGARVCSTGRHGKVQIWDTKAVKEEAVVEIGSLIADLGIPRGGKRFYATTQDGHLVYGDIATGKDSRLKLFDDPGRGIAFSPDGRTIAVGDLNSKIVLLSVRNGK